MNCWDCYRLMKIGEALGYRPLAEYTRGIVKLEQGRVFFSVKSEKTRRLDL